jgi:hypothetical protein
MPAASCRPCDERERSADPWRIRIPMQLERSYFLRLILGDRAARQVAEPHLQRRDYDRDRKGEFERIEEEPLVLVARRAAQERCCTESCYEEERRLDACDLHVQERDDRIRIEYGGHVVGHEHLAVLDLDADRDLHPGIRDHDPEARKGSAQRDHAIGEEMHSRFHFFPAEYEYAEECCLKREGDGRFESKDIAEKVAGCSGECRPVGAELEFKRESGCGPDDERKDEEFRPEADLPVVARILRTQPLPFEEEYV